MVRSVAFTTQGRLHSRNIEMFLMPTLLADTNLFLWVDLENPTSGETKFLLEDVFHFHPLSIEDCVRDSHCAPGAAIDASARKVVEGGIVADLAVLDVRGAGEEHRQPVGEAVATHV